MFSYQILRDKGRPNHRTYYKKVASAEKLGERRVKFTFKRNASGSIDREMPLIIALMPVLPQHDWSGRDFNQTTLRFPIGSGPYKIEALDPGRSITYARDKNYRGRGVPAQSGMYNFDTIRIDYYRDESISLQAFKAGNSISTSRAIPINGRRLTIFPAAHDGRVRLERLEHHRTEPASGFVFNTRRELFKDAALRAALEYTFDFEWINKNLFHGQYHRTTSFFPNSELAAPPLPEGKELEILEKYKSQLPPAIFTELVTPPASNGGEDGLRDNLLKAEGILRQAGYTLKSDQLYTPSGTPVRFEILLGDPVGEKVALTWLRALKRLGIDARVHTVDSAQFQARMAAFDFDVTVARWFNSLSPGNEQTFFWARKPPISPAAAIIPASRIRSSMFWPMPFRRPEPAKSSLPRPARSIAS